ncbi:MAG: recombinase A [Myxococcaceae bacterium]|nr:recombinase A [Myxococcaceae bacterium]
MLPLRLEELREKLRAPSARAGHAYVPAPPWFARALPDGGFPIGITELSARSALGGATLILAQTMALALREPQVSCAWVDPEGTLHAPGLMQQGVELTRLLVVRPPRERLQATCVRIAKSGAVALMAVDFHPVGGKRVPPPYRQHDERWVRRLQLACEEGGTAALLVTDARAQQPGPLPVALKLLLEHPAPSRLCITVKKERAGRVGQITEVELP